MSKRTCSIEGCGRPHDARGFCNSHYAKWRRHGSPVAPTATRYLDPVEALAARTRKTDSCWEWTGAVDERGYGTIRIDRKAKRVHRFAWERTHGPIPEGMEVDHTCWNPSCVNPDHLRLVSRAQNNRNLSGARQNNKSTGVRNVYPNGRGYMVQIRKDGVFHHGGTYASVAEAESVAIRMRAELFGDYAGRNALAEVGLTENTETETKDG